MPPKNNKKGNRDDGNDEQTSPSKPAVISPEKRDKSLFAFALNSGKFKTYKTKKAADKFAKNFPNIIHERLLFKSEEDFDTYKSKHAGANSFKNDKEYTHDEPIAIHLDDQEKEDADKIEEMRKQTFSCNRIALDYYVSELSMAVIVFISYLTPSGTNFWLIKSNHVEQTMNSYIRVKPTLFPKVNHILKNLKQIAARDLSKGPDDTLKNKTGYTVNRLYSYFILPEDKVTTQTEELEYIEEVLKQTGECIQQISTNNVYMSALETTVKNTGKGTFYKVMMNPNSGMNYTEYIKSTSVQIQRVKRFNLMAQESKIKYLNEIIGEHACEQDKYTTMEENNTDE